MRDRLPFYDRTVATLIEDLHQRGLNRKVLLLVTGEFGRTPRIDKNAPGRFGRDHCPVAMSILISGGSGPLGSVIGATNSNAEFPIARELDPDDIRATLMHNLGIDYSQELPDSAGWPLPLCYGRQELTSSWKCAAQQIVARRLYFDVRGIVWGSIPRLRVLMDDQSGGILGRSSSDTRSARHGRICAAPDTRDHAMTAPQPADSQDASRRPSPDGPPGDGHVPARDASTVSRASDPLPTPPQSPSVEVSWPTFPGPVAPLHAPLQEEKDDAPSPQRIGRYRVERFLGQGGFGRVYLAEDDQLQRRVAVKVPHGDRIASAQDAAPYLTEARIVASLDHPHIVPVYDVGSDDDCACFLVSKLIEGATLARMLQESRPTWADAATLVATIAEALHHAHRKGLVHRNVKPGNILVDRSGKPYVADFGLALREQDPCHPAEIAGTPAYMSPEQARGEGHRIDGRSDVFSLGVVFYEMLTGRLPFQGNSQVELLERVARGEARPPRQWDEAIPKELERICLKALSRRASDRYTTTRDMADDLRHWSASTGAPARQFGTPHPDPTTVPELPPSGPDKAVFVSYASPDREAAFRICRILEEQGIGCWIAPRDVRPGDDYGASILRAIEASAVMVLVFSAHANASVHVKNEVERAVSKRKRVIPVRLEDAVPGQSLELHLATAHRVDAWSLSPDQLARQLTQAVGGEAEKAPPSMPIVADSDSRQLRIVPKGLRSFDAHDADFFLELLPGPRDRNGLPDSIRFWKTRMEESDPDSTFAVGLIYGPSGCGKSSLVKAGLLPRLADHVVSVYVEASADETESRLINGLRKRCSGLPQGLDLSGTLAALRRGQGLPPDEKVVLVLDQFEQWLHAKKDEQNTELVQALRQCDGRRVQCVVMVRDDFWLAVSRFLRELEVRLLEGHNSALTDLFDPEHARKVLAAFGRAFSRLGQTGAELSNDQTQFLDQAVAGLSQEGKVICVRLALFADIMKGKPWTLAALKGVGGAEGVGVTFLEETFSTTTAPPEHRLHQKAARGVLKALLPESGTDIKGHMRSREELLDVSGYGQRPKDFDGLLAILDGELHLITPTDPEGKNGENESSALVASDGKFYQLTHDYLVPSLRDWLTRKQRETRRGRAELLLAERSAVWNAKPDHRHLPAWHEHLRIRALTKKTNWTEPQRRLMRTSRRHHATRWGLALVLLFVLGFAAQRYESGRRQEIAKQTVDSFLTVPADAVPIAIANLKSQGDRVLPILRERFADASKSQAQRLHAAIALADFREVDTTFLVGSIATAADEECRNIVTALMGARDAALPRLHERYAAADVTKDATTRARLAIVALHLGEARAAIELCRIAADPTSRRIFEETLATWNGGLKELAEPVTQADDEPLRAAVCLGLGRMKPGRVPDAERSAITQFLLAAFQHAPDTGTHGAADWALRQWKVELPALADARQPSDKRSWYVNSVGITLLKMPKGTFCMGSDKNANNPAHDVTLTRAFYLADREVSVGQFRQFIKDSDTRESEKPLDWAGHDERFSPTAAHPVQQVSWYDAVLFCNWLSRREGRTAAYERTGEKETYDGREYDAWRRKPDADGYRLPTEAEWECACRAGTTTLSSCGDDEEVLRQYAVFNSGSTGAGGGRLPNGRGLFDMHGNVWEWCGDWYSAEAAGKTVDPQGPQSGSDRVGRGGSWYSTALDARSAYRSRFAPEFRDYYLGFRLATVPSVK